MKSFFLVVLAALLPAVMAPAAQRSPDARVPPAGGARQDDRTTSPPTPHIVHPGNYKFPVSQTFVYDVEWRLWQAGTATLGISAEADGTMRTSATADSTGVVSVLYPVHDQFKAIFDPRTFCSQSLTKHVEEGFHAHETLISFNYERRRSMLDETSLKNNQRKHEEYEIPGCVSDVVSGIFYVAALPLQPKASYTFPLNDGGKTVDVTVQVEDRETVTTPAGQFPTIRVSPHAAAGPVKDKGQIWVWYSDDARHIPVQMRARLFWGTLTFRLLRIDQKGLSSSVTGMP